MLLDCPPELSLTASTQQQPWRMSCQAGDAVTGDNVEAVWCSTRMQHDLALPHCCSFSFANPSLDEGCCCG
jgi:hypothetical protein